MSGGLILEDDNFKDESSMTNQTKWFKETKHLSLTVKVLDIGCIMMDEGKEIYVACKDIGLRDEIT